MQAAIRQSADKTTVAALTRMRSSRFIDRAATVRTVERLVGRGELPVLRVGRMLRISRAALMQWLERGSVVEAPGTLKEAEHGQRGF